jgi:hypothetical protein
MPSRPHKRQGIPSSFWLKGNPSNGKPFYRGFPSDSQAKIWNKTGYLSIVPNTTLAYFIEVGYF